MEDRKMVAAQFIKEGHPKKLVLKNSGVPRSSFYYKPVKNHSKRGIQKSTHTKREDGIYVTNEQVVDQITVLLSKEFIDYGYLKVTHWPRNKQYYVINPKKVYRLMREAEILNKFKARKKGKRNWVKELLPPAEVPFDYLEFDIKYIYVAGLNRNALLLTVIDVMSRWVVGHYMSWKVRKKDVIDLFDQIFEAYPLPRHIHVRNDNGSQFIAEKVQSYFKGRNVKQEFCKPATPEQNAHIESYHSILEKVICQRYEFENLLEAQNTFNRFVEFYNFERIHSGIGYQSPNEYLLENGIKVDKNQLVLSMDSSSLKCSNAIY